MSRDPTAGGGSAIRFRSMVEGFRCAICAEYVDVSTPFAWRCPNVSPDDPFHVLHIVEDGSDPALIDDPNPFVRFGPRLAWWSFARANGMSTEDCIDLTCEVAEGFRVTPFGRSDTLSDQLGCEVWVKDETGNVAGSHKARHLATILLHLCASERLDMLGDRPPLAIASCGNAALAAAILAARLDWPIDVYVPTWMDDAFGRRLDRLGARIHRCARNDSDPAGDPAMLGFRRAVAAGAMPFTVQGPENAYCLDGGRTIGWEIREQAASAGVTLDRSMIQVGGGAFAACVAAGLGPDVRLDTVQTEGCAPLSAAWGRLGDLGITERAWSDVMRPWSDPHSVADGILDDESYDWVADVAAMRTSGGRPVVAPESDVVSAHQLATAAGFDVSPTGSAGLAGLLAAHHEMSHGDCVVIVMSGIARH